MYFTYVLLTMKGKQLYTGYTNDLRNRFKEHTKGRVFSTKNKRPLKLIYYEACLNQEDAIRREKTLKSGRGKTYLKKRLKRFLQCSGFGPETGNP